MEDRIVCEHCALDSHMVGVEIRGLYDGVLYWQCRGCGGTQHRWEEGTRQHAQAEPYMHGPKDLSEG